MKVFSYKRKKVSSVRNQVAQWQVYLSMRRRRSVSKRDEWIAVRRNRGSFPLTQTSLLLRFGIVELDVFLCLLLLLRCCKAFCAELLSCHRQTSASATGLRDLEGTSGFRCSRTGILTRPFLAVRTTTSIFR